MNAPKTRLKKLRSLLILATFLQPTLACWAETDIITPINWSPSTSQLSDINSTTLLAQQPVSDEGPLKAGITTTDPTAAMNDIDELTRQILIKIIHIERFNLNYSMNVAKQGRWKGWRYAGWQEVNAGMGLAGAIIGTANRGTNLRTPNRVWVQVQESACFIPMIGAIIGASAAAFEFWVNEYHDMEATYKGFSPHKARAYVMGLNKDITDLLAKRDTLLQVEASAPDLAPHTAIDTAEGKVLLDLRNQAILEFARFHVNARKLLAFQQAQYLFDIAKYTLNAVGYQMAFESLHVHARRYNMYAGVLWDIAGPIYMGAPIVSRIIGKGVGEWNKHFLKPLTKDVEGRTIQTLEADSEVLARLSAAVPAPSLTAAMDRKDMYKLQDKRFADEIASGLKSRANAKLSATQNIGAGFVVGALKLTQGIVFTVPGAAKDYNAHTARANRVTNTDLFVGSVVSLPAGAIAMVDTFRIQVQGEINRRKLLREGKHPTQVVAQRLKELDDMEAKLNAAGKGPLR